jgi:hypothetical protein
MKKLIIFGLMAVILAGFSSALFSDSFEGYTITVPYSASAGLWDLNIYDAYYRTIGYPLYLSAYPNVFLGNASALSGKNYATAGSRWDLLTNPGPFRGQNTLVRRELQSSDRVISGIAKLEIVEYPACSNGGIGSTQCASYYLLVDDNFEINNTYYGNDSTSALLCDFGQTYEVSTYGDNHNCDAIIAGWRHRASAAPTCIINNLEVWDPEAKNWTDYVPDIYGPSTNETITSGLCSVAVTVSGRPQIVINYGAAEITYRLMNGLNMNAGSVMSYHNTIYFAPIDRADSLIVGAGMFSAGASGDSSATVFDNWRFGTGTSANTAPIASFTSISPSNPGEEDSLQCYYTYYDANGDPDQSEQKWFINGNYYGSDMILLPGTFSAGDTVTCVIDVYDGFTHGTPGQATISNILVGTQPESGAFVVDQQLITNWGSQLNCTWRFTSIIGVHTDNSTYTWNVDGAPTGIANMPLNASEYAEGDAVMCIVTPSNGTIQYVPVVASIVVGQTGYNYASRALCLDPDDLSVYSSAVIQDNENTNITKLIVSDITGDGREDYLSDYLYDMNNEEIIADLGANGWVMPFDPNSDQKTDILYSTGSQVILLESAIKPTVGAYSNEASLDLDCKSVSDNKVQIQFLPSGPSENVKYVLYPSKYGTAYEEHNAIEDNIFTVVGVQSGEFTAKGVVTYYLDNYSQTVAEAECRYVVSVVTPQNCAFDDDFDYSTPINDKVGASSWLVSTMDEITPVNSEITLNGYAAADTLMPCSRNQYVVETIQTIDDTNSDLSYYLSSGNLASYGDTIYTVRFYNGNIYFDGTIIGTYAVGTEFVLEVEISMPATINASQKGTAIVYYSDNKIHTASLQTSAVAGLFSFRNYAGLAKIDRVRILPLTGSSQRIDITATGLADVGQDLDCSGNYGRDAYDVFSAACTTYGTKQIAGTNYCTLADLKQMFSSGRSDSQCFDQALSYCTYISYPLEMGLEKELPYETSKFASACSTELLLTASADSILVPMGNALGNFAKNNLVFVLVVVVLLVVLLPVLMRRKGE